MSEFTIIRTPPKWFSWRDIVSLLLGITVLLLVLQVGDLRRELQDRPTAEQFTALTDQLETKDTRIRQLTDLLIKNRIPVPPEPAPTPDPTLARPGLTPSPPGSSPDPPSGRSSTPRPRPTRTSASPQPPCVVVLAGVCITPPPNPDLSPLLTAA